MTCPTRRTMYCGSSSEYEMLKPWDLDFIETPGVPLSYRVEDKLRVAVNPAGCHDRVPVVDEHSTRKYE
jgi:hypothetical protein